MADVSCARCGNEAAGLEREPLPGATGQLVLERTCGSCWSEWLANQVKLLNEHRLTPANPEHYDFLIQQMRAFLNLGEE